MNPRKPWWRIQWGRLNHWFTQKWPSGQACPLCNNMMTRGEKDSGGICEKCYWNLR